MRRIRLHRDFPQCFSAFVGVVLVIFSFQANYELADSKIGYFSYYCALFITIFVLLHRRIKPSTCLMMVLIISVGTVFFGPAKALGLALLLPFGYYTIKYQKSQVEVALVCILFINFIVVFAQFIGWSESVYKFSHYSNAAATYRSFMDCGLGFSGFLPQFRPSGIFPSPTYVSSFCVLFFTLVMATSNYRNRFVFFLFGIHMAMLGSTVGLSLCIISIPLIKFNRRLGFLILGYIIMLAGYAVYLPRNFHYNFNYDDIWISFFARLNIANYGGESVIQQNPAVFLVICLMLFIGMLNVKRIAAFFSLIPFAIALMLPALVHNVSFSLFYWFLVGGAFGKLTSETTWLDNVYKGPSRVPFRKATKPLSQGKY